MMGKQKRTRAEAFDVVFQALDLAQNLDFEVKCCDPNSIKFLAKYSRKKLLKMLIEKHKIIVSARNDAYDLVNTVGDWAGEYPAKKEGNK